MLDIDNMSFDEIEEQLDKLVDSPEFDQISKEFFGDLIEADNGKEERKNFENTWNLNKNAERFIYWC